MRSIIFFKRGKDSLSEDNIYCIIDIKRFKNDTNFRYENVCDFIYLILGSLLSFSISLSC